jgi:transcriptional regulator
MYHVPSFNESDTIILRELVRDFPLATIVNHDTDGGLNANHIPLIWCDDGSEHGVLRGHVARANPLCHDHANGSAVLAIFQGTSGYISPSWYATKAETHKVVPTYNYTALHCHGTLAIKDDTDWLLTLLNDLTDKHEQSFKTAWSVSDAPAEYIQQMMKVIIGIEISIHSLQGKWKVSQNQPQRNQASVLKSLTELGQHDMANLVNQRMKPIDKETP